MTTFVLTYDLIKNKDYPTLWDELEKLGAHRALDSFWLISVKNSAKEVHAHFKNFIDKDDKVWVSELTTNNWYTGANAGTNAWIKANAPAR
ncbi:CRISPR-associated protein Cas2 [Allopontixanthobacter sediminis]|uniref:CRISPR-associated protein Cas2 n=1 Tax=Allopontixanthobacter sediminis TaxID=1689985 RepID=A0A845B0D1_9SPHN|nr:CRISPR-associated protein Cas2 [Allopontixanthobacter sediminis]MXP43688.1 CRISPR-associated protein Cas2 [Allopontixanthobacter sediminis]